jgi:hypothetical protein
MTDKVQVNLRKKIDSGWKPTRKRIEHEGQPLEDWAYLIHHVHVDGKSEKLHHCQLLDHLGNFYEIEHIIDKQGNTRHAIKGLAEQKTIYWSDEDARDDKQQVPCANRQLEKPR